MAFPDGWQRKCAIVIQAAQVAETLTDFPMLITDDNLPAEIWENADDGGGDLRFSADDAGTVRLACEIVRFDTTGETAEIYVKVPSVSSAVNTTIYIWYNNTGQTQPPATDTYGSQAVWSSDYAAVYHFNQNPAGGTLLDSTANGNNGTVKGGMDAADLVDGKIGANSAWDFDGVNDWVDCNDGNVDGYNNITLLLITRSDNVNKNYATVIAKAWSVASSYMIRMNSATGYLTAAVAQDTGNSYVIASSSELMSANNEMYLASFNRSELKLYKNGTIVGNAIGTSPVNNSVYRLAIAGATNDTGLQSGNYWDGIIDEVRILSSYMTDESQVSFYNNLFNPATFAIAGTPTAVSAFNPAWAKHSNQIIRAI